MQLSNSLTPRSIASSNYLLRQYGGAAAAYSLQRLDTSVENVVRARRSTDDAEADFTAQEVSGGSLREFALNNDADLIRFADQSVAADKRMYFDGSDDDITLPALSLVTATGWRVDFSAVFQRANPGFFGTAATAGLFAASTTTWYLIDDASNAATFGSLPFALNTIYHLSLRCDGSVFYLYDVSGGVDTLIRQVGVGSVGTVSVDRLGLSRGRRMEGLLYDVKISNTGNNTTWVAELEGYGNTDADWEDQVGSNDGTVNGSPALFSGQGFDAYVTTLYDQSGNGRNATQSTAASQPQIVADGVVVTDADGIPAMSFDGVNDKLGVSGETIITGDSTGEWSGFSVQEITIADIGFVYGNTVGGGAGTSLRVVTSPTSYTVSNATTTADYIARGLTKDLVSTCYNNGDAKLKLNGGGTPVSGSYTYTAATLDFTIGDWPNSSVANSAMLGKISEIVIYPTDKSANRAAIEANIASRYGITI